MLARTIYELERAGLAGCHLEDQEFPKRCGHLAGKSTGRARGNGRQKSVPRWRRNAIAIFLIIARTDARAVENFDGAVKRAQAYVAAGADAIFPEALQTKEEFRDFAQGSEGAAAREHDGVRQKPAASRRGTGRARLSDGYLPAERVSRFDESDGRIFPRPERKRARRKSWLERMQTRKELYETTRITIRRRKAGRDIQAEYGARAPVRSTRNPSKSARSARNA